MDSKRLVFFNPKAGTAYRRHRLGFALVLFVSALALIWPVYEWFAGIRPLILGLPLSLAWIILWLLIVFIGLVFLYRSDYNEKA